MFLETLNSATFSGHGHFSYYSSFDHEAVKSKPQLIGIELNTDNSLATYVS